MGIFSKLFEKKECSVCGGEIGLLGNRKLEDGNLCKKCAAKLSPLFSGRRNATVDEIKAQLAYREENREKLASFNPTKTFGSHKKIYIDEAAGTFIITGSSNWRDANPDIIAISQVTACNIDIRENKDEIYRETDDGKSESYDPPRYEYIYDFTAEILVNSPWFNSIEFELSDGDAPDSRYTEKYHKYEEQLHELQDLLTGKKPEQPSEPAAAVDTQPESPAVAESAEPDGKWVCAACGADNTGNFCESCGTKKPEEPKAVGCGKCGWKPDDGDKLPKFCPECGAPINSGE